MWLVPGVWLTRTVVSVKSTSSSECVRQAIRRLPEFTENSDPGVADIPNESVNASLERRRVGIDVLPLSATTFQIRAYGSQWLTFQPWRTIRIRKAVDSLVSLVSKQCGSAS
jgi:hypothetical protein